MSDPSRPLMRRARGRGAGDGEVRLARQGLRQGRHDDAAGLRAHRPDRRQSRPARRCWCSPCCASRPRARRAPLACARAAGRHALLTAALQDAVTQLQAQERAMAARAEASERLSGEIVGSLTAGLLVVGLDGEVRILNPSAGACSDCPRRRRPTVSASSSATSRRCRRHRRVPDDGTADRAARGGAERRARRRARTSA